MTYWNHRYVEVEFAGGETEVGLYEVYYRDDGTPTSRTQEPATFTGETAMEAMNAYSMAQRAMGMPVLKDSDIGGGEIT